MAAASVILIIVHNPAHRVLFNRYLKATPHHLVFSADGEDGFDRFGEVKPDLVLLHIDVSRLDGTILCQLLRQQPRGDTTPIVLLGDELTDGEHSRSRVASVGADHYLPVPFSRSLLLEVITPLLAFGRPRLTSTQEGPAVKLPALAPAEVTDVGLELGLDDRAELEAPPPAEPRSPQAMAALAELEALLVPERPEAQGPELDTVVSFKNPFHGLSDKGPPGVVSSPALTGDLTGPSGRRGPMPTRELLPDERVDRVRAPERGPTERARTSTLPSVAEFLADELGPQDALPPSPTVDLSGRRADALLEEPAISAPVPRLEPAASMHSQLIHEQPLEPTPTAGKAARRGGPDGGQRRGLDESQLGKRLAKRVRTMFRLLDEVDYYQLLGVQPGVSFAELKQAHFELSLELHPDRFFLLPSGDLKEKIYVIYRRLSEAFAVLSDDERRAAYDRARRDGNSKRASAELATDPRLAAPEPGAALFGAVARTREGQPLVTAAERWFAEGDLVGARLGLGLARAYESDNASLDRALEDLARRVRPSI